jgi:hypothetical protein
MVDTAWYLPGVDSAVEGDDLIGQVGSWARRGQQFADCR